ncbi:hypothetical protein MSIMFI_05554 [Mycobacterium simulans]|nr:hypothetical protein MSIMFI_05554 [Mycobacterium simulans]
MRWCGVGLSGHGGGVDVDEDQVMPGEPVGQVGGGKRHYRGGVFNHESDASIGIGRIDRQISGPGLKNRQDRDDGIGGTLQQQRYHITRSHPVMDQ